MSRILVIGGYGGFGARLTKRLLANGHQVLVAGRSGERAAAFCAAVNASLQSSPGGRGEPRSGGEGVSASDALAADPLRRPAGATSPTGGGFGLAEPVVADRTNGIGMVLARERPDLVIDAAGPFQGSGYIVPEACIAMRIPYLDLADSREFVVGIERLNKCAKIAVPIVSGASSVPALSGAVGRKLSVGIAPVWQIEIAISASNRAVAGPSVAAAILSYVGKPVTLWRGRGAATSHGWQELRRERFAIAGEVPLKRWVALAEVPDLDLLPLAVVGRPAVTFRAGTELGFQVLALWLLSGPVRWGWIGSLRPVAGWLHKLQRLTAWAGSDRSAMSVTLKANRIERRWTLIASDGDGPEIPTLAAELLAEDILAGRLSAGAYDASCLLDLDRFEALFTKLSIRTEISERAHVPLYARAMGARFAALPPRLREIHDLHGDGGARGEGMVTRGRGLAHLLGRVMGFPPAGDYPVHVAFAERDGRERWTRDFDGHRFSSELALSGEGVSERFGPLRFHFDLPSDASGLRMKLRGWTLAGVPMPRFLGPRIDAREWEEDGRFRFEVRVAMPLIGDIVHYTGWLQRA